MKTLKNKIYLLKNFLIYCILLTTHVTALRWPTKSLSHFHPSRSIICAVGPPPFIACAETKYWPSGDHDNLKTCVVPPHSSNGSTIVLWQLQSDVFHILTERSSLCDAKNLPTGSHVTPLTKPEWPFKRATIDGNDWTSHTIIWLSTLQLANHWSCGDQAKSSTSP